MTTTEYRLEIEGLQAQPVTSPLLERTLVDTRVRIRGLVRDGLGFTEKVDPVRAELEMQGFTATIVEQPGDLWTSYLAKTPDITTFLQTDIAASGSETLTLLSTSGISALDVLHIGTEALLVQTVVDATDVVVGAVGRGFWGTIPQAHYTEDGERLQRPAVSIGSVPSLERRRAYLYRYDLGAGDDPQGDGTLVLRGICATDASLGDGGTAWGITIDPLTTVLDVDLGSDLDYPTFPRGYDFTGSGAAEFRVWTVSSGGVSAVPSVLTLTDFYESTEELEAVLAAHVESATAGVQLGATVEISNGVLTIRFSSDGSLLDASFDGQSFVLDDESAVGAGDNRSLALTDFGTSRGSALRPGDRIYPANLPAVVAGDTVSLSTEDIDGGEATTYNTIITTANLAEGWVEVASGFDNAKWNGRGPEISFSRWYARNANVAGFRDALVANSPTLANKQGFPLLTSADLADWSTVAGESGIYAQTRGYVAAAEVGLIDWLTQEFRLANLFPSLDNTGALTLNRLELPTPTTPTSFTLDGSTIFANDEPVSWERQSFGTVSIVTIRTGYDYIEDEHRGRTYRFRDPRSPSPQELVVEPKSLDAPPALTDGRGFTVPAMTQVARNKLAFYSRPYVVVTCQVPHTLLFDALVGSFCAFSNHRLPNPQTGGRGVEGAVGLVVGRSWDFSTEVGTLDIFLAFDTLAGYAPEIHVVSQSGSGTSWTLELSDGDPLGLTQVTEVSTVEDLFEVGDLIEVYDWGTSSPTFATGEITAVTSSTVSVTFDASWTPPATPVLRPQSYGSAGANLERYFFAADDTGALGSINARLFG